MLYVDLRCDFNAIAIKKNDDPAGLFDQISDIKNRYNSAAYKIGEEQLQAAVLEISPDAYHGVLTVDRRAKGDACATENLQEAMNELWRKLGRKKERSEDNTEIILGAFVGTCYSCGTNGHVAKDCRKPKKNKVDSRGVCVGNKFKGKLKTCGMCGHMTKDCFEDEKNASKRPNGCKSKKEHGNVNVDVDVDVGVDVDGGWRRRRIFRAIVCWHDLS
jgi:hypothetical protein